MPRSKGAMPVVGGHPFRLRSVLTLCDDCWFERHQCLSCLPPCQRRRRHGNNMAGDQPLQVNHGLLRRSKPLQVLVMLMPGLLRG